MVTKNQFVKLPDFESAGTSYNVMMHTFLGTSGFQAPEIIAGTEYSEKCDVCSWAICL
jgi:serine/threonine protein kinase